MSGLPQPLLAPYWIPYVGIGNPLQDVVVPLTDILKYTLPDGTPQTKVVFLGFAAFNGTPNNFAPPYLSIPQGIIDVMTLQPGQTQTQVQQLQAAGIKVLLSVAGYNNQMGWDNIPYGPNGKNRYQNMIAFAQWVQMNVIVKYGLDGIDIDDEWGASTPHPEQAFMDTVGILRYYLEGFMISKALWQDYGYFNVAVSADAPYNAGAKLAGLLDLGCTMDYSASFDMLRNEIKTYTVKCGMTWDQLCVGVQAGPSEAGGMTPLDEVTQIAKWAVTPTSSGTPPVLGMMLFTFTQDIQQWDQWKQNQPRYKWPNPGDHLWQRTIVENMWPAMAMAKGKETATAEAGQA